MVMKLQFDSAHKIMQKQQHSVLLHLYKVLCTNRPNQLVVDVVDGTVVTEPGGLVLANCC